MTQCEVDTWAAVYQFATQPTTSNVASPTALTFICLWPVGVTVTSLTPHSGYVVGLPFNPLMINQHCGSSWFVGVLQHFNHSSHSLGFHTLYHTCPDKSVTCWWTSCSTTDGARWSFSSYILASSCISTGLLFPLRHLVMSSIIQLCFEMNILPVKWCAES